MKTANLLERDVPQTGILADAYHVATTAMLLRAARPDGPTWEAARHAVTLHRISGWLHRLAERQCNEDLTCRECDGSGYPLTTAYGKPARDANSACRACAGRGVSTGRREARLEAEAQAIAEHYGMVCYFQGDPRGCSLYLIDPETVPQSWAGVPGEPLERYVYDREATNPPPLATLQARWIAANYNRGHAIVRVGR